MMTLTYRSDAAILLPFSAVADICLHSAERNRKLGVTGFLVEHEGVFLQVLEGKRHVVEPLFDRIAADARHRNVTVLACENSDDQRSFGFWSMNFGPLNDPRFWDGEFRPFRDRAVFRRHSYSADFALRTLTRAYSHACILADRDPVIGGFVQGLTVEATPTLQGA